MPEVNNIEIRSEEIEEILGKTPNWIVRWGITVIFLVIALFFIASWFFKYPTVVNSSIIITTENIPAVIVAKTTGKLTDVLVTDNQSVKKNDYLAILENTANFKHVREVTAKMDSLKPYLVSVDSMPNVQLDFSTPYSLGELQTSYASFVKSYIDYKDFIQKDYQHKKIASIQGQIAKYKKMYRKLMSQQDIMQQKLSIGNVQYGRDSSLYSNKTIAMADLERSKSSLLDNQYSYVSASTTMDNTLITISQLEQTVLELEQDYAEKKKEYEQLLKESFDNMRGQLKLWEQTYVLKSPIDGVVTFTKFWSVNQNVAAGDKVLTVVPVEKSNIVGRIMLPEDGSGKVKIGQKVNVKLKKYPYMEYGMLRGTIKSMSLVPSDNVYLAEVVFTEGLKTNYGKKLDLGQDVQGTAEVITEDIRLIERFYNPIKSLLKSQE